MPLFPPHRAKEAKLYDPQADARRMLRAGIALNPLPIRPSITDLGVKPRKGVPMTIQSSTQDRVSSTDPGNASRQAHPDRIRRLTFKSDLDRIDQGIRDSVRRHANRDQAAIS